MALSSLDGYLAGAKQRLPLVKTASRTSVALIPFSVFDLAGNPGAGTLAGSSTTNGVKPTSATSGTPIINPFSGTNKGYLTKVEYYNSVISTLHLYDLLFKAGNYTYNSGTTTLSSQPAINDRCPDDGGGAAFGNGNEIWIEVVGAMTSATAWQVQVTYTNQAGTTGRTSIVSAAQAAAALTVGKMFQIALQAGDSGVQKIESVIVTTGGATAGSFNVLIMRRLWSNRITVANSGFIDDILKTGAPEVYDTSALFAIIQADGTSTGLPNLNIEITNVP